MKIRRRGHVRARTPARQPFSHPTDEDLSVGAPWMPALQLLSGASFAARQPFSHPTDEDLSVGAP